MNDEKYTIENEPELTPEEEAAIDRILKETAEAENAKIDYSAMHDAIIRKAREQGVVVFAKPAAAKNEKKNKSKGIVVLRRVLTGVAAAAAVFLIGFATFSVLKNAFGPAADRNITAQEDGGDKTGDLVVTPGTEDIKKETPSTWRNTPEPASEEVGNTPVPMIPENTPDPIINLPEGYETVMTDPTKGIYVVTVDFRALGAADVEPVDYSWLEPDFDTVLPEELKGVMQPDEEALDFTVLYFRAADVKTVFVYECSVVGEKDVEGIEELDVGAARFDIVEKNETVSVVWRISEELWIKADLKGFTADQAEELLLSLPVRIEQAA